MRGSGGHLPLDPDLDSAEDVLTGSAGQDWFLAQLNRGVGLQFDKVTNLGASEFVDDLDFITSVYGG